jgi:hypothetical protein
MRQRDNVAQNETNIESQKEWKRLLLFCATMPCCVEEKISMIGSFGSNNIGRGEAATNVLPAFPREISTNH